MIYPIALINSYSAGKISRETFTRRWAKAQGFNGTIKAYSNGAGTFAEYRGRTARLNKGVLIWQERGREMVAHSFKEYKIKVDMEAEAWKAKAY